MTLDAVDLTVIALYAVGILGMSLAFARRQRTGDDYFLAGRRMGTLPLALSILANQASTVSLVGAPAFVALREGGGLRWLQYELALPLAMLGIIIVLLPTLRAVPASSIYAFAERRYGRGTRRLLAGAFVLSRGLALGVILYASALVVAEALGWRVESALIALGMFSVAYTSLGGIVADIWSDVIQVVVLWLGTVLASGYVLYHWGTQVVRAVPPDRAATLVLDANGLTDGQSFAFWPMLFGGLFLYMSYYGCDQSQAQRLLTAKDDAAARNALILNGLLRFPLVLTYCAFGLLLAGLLQSDSSFAATMDARPADSLVPVFLTTILPSGFRGVFLAALLAAAMSSIDSAMNSLAAVTLEDVFDRPSGAQSVWTSRAVSLAWGIFAVVSGLVFARLAAGVLETINQVGSAFYGPLLAVFALAVLAPGVTGRGASCGLIAGLLGNLLLARLAPGVSWLWWNPFGFVVAAVVALLVSRATPTLTGLGWPRPGGVVLVAAFVLMLALLAALPLV